MKQTIGQLVNESISYMQSADHPASQPANPPASQAKGINHGAQSKAVHVIIDQVNPLQWMGGLFFRYGYGNLPNDSRLF